jgi:3-methyladenine DNA glycosylase/8-oxoguanine DNA glycosylase
MVVLADALSPGVTLAPLRQGRHDPTTRLAPGEFVRATLTPQGPGTVQLRWHTGSIEARAWGPGADFLLAGVDALVGATDSPHRFVDAHPAILAAQRNHPHLRLGASGNLYHDLLPTILAQRITAGEAVTQWRRLCERLGEPAPGPFAGLLLPPQPQRLGSTPSWWFHPLGIERKRAEPLITVARHADSLWRWAAQGSAVAAGKMALLRGVGEWTIGVVLGLSLGEPDAVAVGDYHLKNTVAHALAGEARATDERMLELLAPYRGQRGRVVRLLQLDGHGAPKFGPRQRVLPMARW